MTVKEALKLHPDMSREEAKAYAKSETGKRLADKYGWGKRPKESGGDASGGSAPDEGDSKEAAPKQESEPAGVMLPDIEDEIRRAPKVEKAKPKAPVKPKAKAPTMRDDADPEGSGDDPSEPENGSEGGLNVGAVLPIGLAALGVVLLLRKSGGQTTPAQTPNAVPTDPLETMIHNV